MLTKDVNKRPSAKELLSHPWFKISEDNKENFLLKNVFEKFVKF